MKYSESEQTTKVKKEVKDVKRCDYFLFDGQNDGYLLENEEVNPREKEYVAYARKIKGDK